MAASDLEAGTFYFGNPAAPEPLTALTIDPAFCEAESLENQCRVYGARHRVTMEGGDEVGLSYSHTVIDGENSADHHDPTKWVGWDLKRGKANWQLQYLDFGTNGFLYECALDAEDACAQVDPSLPGAARCEGNFSHEFVVTEESTLGRRILLTDTGNDRLITAWLPEGELCGEVEEVLHTGMGGWDVYSGPNSLQHRVDDDGARMLLSFRDAETVSAAGRAQHGGPGHGKVTQWVRRDDGWEQEWEVPPALDGDSSFLNVPHGALWAEGPAGEPWLVVAHSLGTSASFMAIDGGSIAVFDLSSGEPKYLYDGIAPDGAFFGFPRDIEPLGDGQFVIVDSGCISSTDCPVPSQAWVVRLPSGDSAGLDGAFRPDHSHQVFVEIEMVEGPFLADTLLLYSITGARD